jgi:hypothetical protein
MSAPRFSLAVSALRISDAKNMSSLKHFERYTAGRGGVDGAINRANVSTVRLLLVD